VTVNLNGGSNLSGRIGGFVLCTYTAYKEAIDLAPSSVVLPVN
jgi:hypothetical protein